MHPSTRSLHKVQLKALGLWAPPPRISVLEHAEKTRVIAEGTSAESGRYRSDRLPYQREPQLHVIEANDLVLMWGTQLGKTEILLNVIEYFIDADPSGIFIVYPTEQAAKKFSETKLQPMIDATPALSARVRPSRSRDSGNRVLAKKYPGGQLVLVGTNSPTNLRQMSCRVVVQDEIDAYEDGAEGDPSELADKRCENFHNAVRLKASSPTEKGFSRIDRAFEDSDQRHYHGDCPKCGHPQRLTWGQVKWPDGKPEDAYLECANSECRAQLTDGDRIRMIMRGRWVPMRPDRKKRGYHLSGLYRLMGLKSSTYRNYLHEFVAGFLDAKKKGREAIRVWTNTFLAEAYEDAAETVSKEPLLKRREEYAHEVPAGTLLLIASADVQGDRIEAEVIGYGLNDEDWGIEYKVFLGNPLSPQVWRDLDVWLLKSRAHPSGKMLTPYVTMIDTGHASKTAYEFIRPRQVRRVYAVKGSNTHGMPLISRPKKSGVKRVRLFQVGTDTAKGVIYAKLKEEMHGPGYCHFPVGRGYDDEYFSQLTAEKVVTRFAYGQRIREWKKTRDRNEALDIRVYALAGLAAALQFHNLDLNKLAVELKVEPETDEEDDEPISSPEASAAPEPAPVIPPPQRARRRMGMLSRIG